MAIEGPYNLEEIFQSVNFDFLTSLPEDGDFGEETLCIPNDALDGIGIGMPWYSEEGIIKERNKYKTVKSFPRTPEREEEQKKEGFLSEAEYSSSSSSSSSSEEGSSSVGFGTRKRRSGMGKRRGGAEGWKRVRIVNGGAAVGGGGERRCCHHCGAEKTPQWRMGPGGPKTLCNACGVRYRSGRLVPEYRPAASPSFDSRIHSNSHRRIAKMTKN
ncbi:hypothetical protein Sjap_018405 [Stephania japonica]|uniref:GATA-type domain-containing protein n=1 Tax=Stephania japonica TaxID=461633 RepID=A0AAP0I801_9MAGN